TKSVSYYLNMFYCIRFAYFVVAKFLNNLFYFHCFLWLLVMSFSNLFYFYFHCFLWLLVMSFSFFVRFNSFSHLSTRSRLSLAFFSLLCLMDGMPFKNFLS